MSKKYNLSFSFGNATHVGQVRSANEDYFGSFDTPNGYVFVVCDGMGGHVGGAKASRLAVEAIKNYTAKELPLTPSEIVNNAITAANQSILQFAQHNPELKGMGSTCVMVLITNNGVFYAHVGDSRIYLLSGSGLVRLTKDHSFVQSLIDMGEITPEEAEHHPRKNEITNALGMINMAAPTVCRQPLHPVKGDTILLCSDGLTGMVAEDVIKSVIQTGVKVQAKADELVALANQAGGVDNVTVQLLSFNDVPARKIDSGGEIITKSKPNFKLIASLAMIVVLLGVGGYFIWNGLMKKESLVLPDYQLKLADHEQDFTYKFPVDSLKNHILKNNPGIESKEIKVNCQAHEGGDIQFITSTEVGFWKFKPAFDFTGGDIYLDYSAEFDGANSYGEVVLSVDPIIHMKPILKKTVEGMDEDTLNLIGYVQIPEKLKKTVEISISTSPKYIEVVTDKNPYRVKPIKESKKVVADSLVFLVKVGDKVFENNKLIIEIVPDYGKKNDSAKEEKKKKKVTTPKKKENLEKEPTKEDDSGEEENKEPKLTVVKEYMKRLEFSANQPQIVFGYEKIFKNFDAITDEVELELSGSKKCLRMVDDRPNRRIKLSVKNSEILDEVDTLYAIYQGERISDGFVFMVKNKPSVTVKDFEIPFNRIKEQEVYISFDEIIAKCDVYGYDIEKISVMVYPKPNSSKVDVYQTRSVLSFRKIKKMKDLSGVNLQFQLRYDGKKIGDRDGKILVVIESETNQVDTEETPPVESADAMGSDSTNQNQEQEQDSSNHE